MCDTHGYQSMKRLICDFFQSKKLDVDECPGGCRLLTEQGLGIVISHCGKEIIQISFVAPQTLHLVHKKQIHGEQEKCIEEKSLLLWQRFFAVTRINGVAREEGGAARRRFHHYGVTPFYDVKP